jgi:sulfonate transport system permease protein
LIGFGIASIAGIILGLAIGLVPFIYIILESIINFLKNIPPIAWIPLAILWFGIGELSKIYIIAYSAFFPILLNTIFGVRSIDKILLKMAKNIKLNKLYFLKEIIIPASLPSIFTGLRIGMGTGWMALIAAEMIGATSGLGFMIEESRQLLLVSRVIVGILSIGFCGFICDKILQSIEKKLITWI